MLEQLANLPTPAHLGLACILGLLVGSFLNVVIYRYPARLHYLWTAQSYQWLNDESYPEAAPPNLVTPPSHCKHCKTSLKVWQNIPILSFMMLRGRCAHCKMPIAWRYPLVELIAGVLSVVVVSHFGINLSGLFALLMTWALIALSFIDLDHQLLPDDLILPLLWLGLVLNINSLYATPSDAIIGAVLGYLSLWSIYWLFKLTTGKEGMGHGDFKLLALFGAWLGWQALPQIILVSTVLGSVIGLTLILSKRITRNQPIPFGPYIAAAGWLALLYDDKINQYYLRLTGL